MIHVYRVVMVVLLDHVSLTSFARFVVTSHIRQ